MEPSLKEGDLIIYIPLNKRKLKEIKPGDIVISNHPLEKTKRIIKRIFKENINGVDIRGDNESNSIDSRHFGLIDKQSIVGILDFILHTSEVRS